MKRRAALLCVTAVLVFGSRAAAQHNPCLTPDRINYGREWRTWTDTIRQIYVEGFMSGQADTYLAVFNDLPNDRREPLRKALFLFHGLGPIADVMTDLYKDPANTFIRYGAMVYIARDKLSGRDVEPMLRNSRENDCSFPKKQ